MSIVANLTQAVTDYNNKERKREAAKWRPQSQDYGTVSRLELTNLSVKASQLQKVLESFQEVGTDSSWSDDDVHSAVTNAQEAYEPKERLSPDNPRKTYHVVMCNLDSHSVVLSMIPKGNVYVSLVAGAIAALVKASLNHHSDIEDLTKTLKEVNDEARACMIARNLVLNEAIQVAIARFYIATFVFYADAVRWFQSSSPDMTRHSHDVGFSKQFRYPLSEINRLSNLVQRAATDRSDAELCVSRLTVGGIEEDIRAGLHGLDRQNSEIRHAQDQMRFEQAKHTAALARLIASDTVQALNGEVWRNTGLSGTTLLQGQMENPIDDGRQIHSTTSAFARIQLRNASDAKETHDSKTGKAIIESRCTLEEPLPRMAGNIEETPDPRNPAVESENPRTVASLSTSLNPTNTHPPIAIKDPKQLHCLYGPHGRFPAAFKKGNEVYRKYERDAQGRTLKIHYYIVCVQLGLDGMPWYKLARSPCETGGTWVLGKELKMWG